MHLSGALFAKSLHAYIKHKWRTYLPTYIYTHKFIRTYSVHVHKHGKFDYLKNSTRCVWAVPDLHTYTHINTYIHAYIQDIITQTWQSRQSQEFDQMHLSGAWFAYIYAYTYLHSCIHSGHNYTNLVDSTIARIRPNASERCLICAREGDVEERATETCICVCICVCVYACMYVCLYVWHRRTGHRDLHMCMHVCVCMYVCLYEWGHRNLHVCVYMYVWHRRSGHSNLHIDVCVCMYDNKERATKICIMQQFMCAFMYACMHTHTHTHTHTRY